MKGAVIALVLLGLLGSPIACAIAVCPVATSHDCCPKPKSFVACPFDILSSAKATVPVAAVPAPATMAIPLAEFVAHTVPCPTPDQRDLHLQNRVLRI